MPTPHNLISDTLTADCIYDRKWESIRDSNELNKCDRCECYTEEKLKIVEYVPVDATEDTPSQYLSCCDDCKWEMKEDKSIIVI